MRDVKGKWLPGYAPNPNGRPVGALARRTQELREKARRLGCDPVEVMINEIRDLLRCAAVAAAENDHDKRRELRMQAVEVAVKLAPYLHPRLANIELSGNPDQPIEHVHRRAPEELTEAEAVEEWRRLISETTVKPAN